ncbi:hypothetical protein RIF29_29792 [Crotalaria pallida]|uniref:Uncharacterized protein n=1 Tax=Crotalaria pallida TaxID=3830 RepID=A0AAN9EKD1_CROPI
MRGEVGGVRSGTSKRKRPKLEECEGSFSQAKVRYKRPTRADNISMSPVPNIVLEDVTNMIQASDCQGQQYITGVDLQSIRDARFMQSDEKKLTDDTSSNNSILVNESPIELPSNSVQHSEVLDAANPNSVVLSYIEMSRYRAEKMSNCDMSDNIECRDPMVGVLGHDKKLTFKSVNSIVCDLSQQFSNVEGNELVILFVIGHGKFILYLMDGNVGCDINCKVAAGDETRSQRDRKSRFDAGQPLRRSKRFKLLSSLSLSEPDWKENIDPDNIDVCDKDDDKLNYSGTEIERILRRSGRSLSDWISMPQPQGSTLDMINNPLIAEQLNFNREEQFNEYQRLRSSMIEEQFTVFNEIMVSISSGSVVIDL